MDDDELATFFGVFHDHHEQNSLDLKCPKCNHVHPYKSADDDDRKNHQVFYSGSLLCAECLQDCTDRAMFAVSCGHLICVGDFEMIGGQEGVTKLSCAACLGKDQAEDDVEKRYSHGARPICWEDFTSSMIALACGHIVCTDVFRRLGGKIGQDALLSAEELTQRQREQVQQLQNEYGSTLSQLIESVSSSEDVRRVEFSLFLLTREFTCASGNAETFVQLSGPAAMVQAMRRFPESLEVQFNACVLLHNLTCTEHQTPQDQVAHTWAVINAGAVSTCIQALRREQSTVRLLGLICNILKGLFKNNVVESVEQFAAIVGALLFVMDRAPNAATRLSPFHLYELDYSMHGGSTPFKPPNT